MASVTSLMRGFRRMLHLGLRQQNAQLRHGNHGQEANEQEEKKCEEAKRADKRPVVPAGRLVGAPRGRQEVTVEAGYVNPEALKPHSGIHDELNYEQEPDLVAHIS